MTTAMRNALTKLRNTPSNAPSADLAPAAVVATAVAARPPNAGTKQADLVALLQRPEGATLDQMTAATGWLPHTTRAALTGLKKRGHAISSVKIGTIRTYRASALTVAS